MASRPAKWIVTCPSDIVSVATEFSLFPSPFNTAFKEEAFIEGWARLSTLAGLKADIEGPNWLVLIPWADDSSFATPNASWTADAASTVQLST